MDLVKTGNFIKEQRKLLKLSQKVLAEKINVSEKTISKWECGNGFPDTSLILPLCEVLNISANELLSAKILPSDEYKIKAEENLIILKTQYDSAVKHLFNIEIVLVVLSTVVYFVLLLCAIFAIENLVWKYIIICLDVIIFLIGIMFAIRIEQVAGFYVCKHCNYKYIPTFKSVFLAPHSFRTRYMKCPNCHKRSWQKKVINKD